MQVGTFNISKRYVTAVAIIFVAMSLLRQHLRGGIGGHYLLQQETLPFVSNWWGVLLLPALTWILWGRIEARCADKSSARELLNSGILFVLGVALGLLISVSFLNEYNFLLDNVVYVLLIVSLIFPIYYAEFMLGFVIAMVNTFGVVLPTVFALIMALVGFLIYRLITLPILKNFRQR
ncbi:MAG: hypothetical protein ACKOEV_01790 [Cytophagales bacterium]